MKLVFIVGSLEYGKDGVGDYTWALVTELQRIYGAKIILIAFNDRYCKEFVEEQQSFNGGELISTIRFPERMNDEERIKLCKMYIENFKPDWISLQYVPYSFHRKGIPLQLAKRLKQLTKNVRWHIMFHELWTEDKEFKSKLISVLQRFIVKHIFNTLKPVLVHTSIPEYQNRLALQNIYAKPLSIFSNISDQNVDAKLSEKRLVIGFFSQMLYRDSVELLLVNLLNQCKNAGLILEIRLIGGSKKTTDEFLGALQNAELRSHIVKTGFLVAKDISINIKQCNLGITPVPRHLIGKSGSTAAFLSHGVPIAAPFDKPGFQNIPLGIFDEEVIGAVLNNPTIEEIKFSTNIAQKFCHKFTSNVVAGILIRDIMET